MDDDLFASPIPPSSSGGSVEPARQAAKPGPTARREAERFELRDRVAGVVHRADTFSEMVAKAEQLGSSLFVAVAPDGKRTSIQKVDGQWQRGPQRPGSSTTPVAPGRTAELSGRGTPQSAAGPAAPAAQRAQAVEGAGPPPTSPAPVLEANTDPADTKERSRREAKAERALFVAQLEAALGERYVIRPAPVSVGDVLIGRKEYVFRGDRSRVAFTETNLRLATDTNHPSVARSMVDVAQVRGWRALRLSGHEDFKRLVWLEASVRGIKALGYEPGPQDLVLLQREREARLVNRIEPDAQGARSPATAGEEKASARRGGRNAVLAAIEALLVAQKVPEKQRVAVMTAAAERLAELKSQGVTPRLKIYDKTAPSHAVMPPVPDVQRSHERAAPARPR
jgi:hypothetical protein